MDYTYVSENVLLKMKNQEQTQESSPSKTSIFSSLWFDFFLIYLFLGSGGENRGYFCPICVR